MHITDKSLNASQNRDVGHIHIKIWSFSKKFLVNKGTNND